MLHDRTHLAHATSVALLLDKSDGIGRRHVRLLDSACLPYSSWILLKSCIFFFQAEDGIRDWSVTGVQTCALPIYSEPVTLDFKGQVEMPSSHPPPSHNSCTPPTLQQSPPVSVQPSTSAIDPVQQLVQALLTIGQNTAAPPPPTLPQPANPMSEPQTHSMAPTLRTCEHFYFIAK